MTRSYRRRKIGGIASNMVRKRTKRQLRRNRRRHTQRGGIFGIGDSNGDDAPETSAGVVADDIGTAMTKANADIDDKDTSYALSTLDKGITTHTHTLPTTGGKHRRSKHRRSKHRRSKHRRSKHRRSKHRRRQRGGTKTTGVVFTKNNVLNWDDVVKASEATTADPPPDSSGNAFVDSWMTVAGEDGGTASQPSPTAQGIGATYNTLLSHTHTLPS